MENGRMIIVLTSPNNALEIKDRLTTAGIPSKQIVIRTGGSDEDLTESISKHRPKVILFDGRMDARVTHNYEIANRTIGSFDMDTEMLLIEEKLELKNIALPFLADLSKIQTHFQ